MAKKEDMGLTPSPEAVIQEATEVMRQILEKYVKDEKMTPKRFEHSVRVAEECKRLAGLFQFNADLAEFAGLVHDICKDFDPEKQLDLVEDAIEQKVFDVTVEEHTTPKLWHGIAGARLLQQKYNVNQTEVLNAVRYHTVARRGMTLLEKIVYLADMTEPGRTFIDVHVLRAATDRSVNLGMYYALQYSIRETIKKGGLLPRHTIEAYNQYVRIIQAKK